MISMQLLLNPDAPAFIPIPTAFIACSNDQPSRHALTDERCRDHWRGTRRPRRGDCLGEHASVLEQAASPGGPCQTVELAGALFDLGGQSFHTPHKAIRDLERASAVPSQRGNGELTFCALGQGDVLIGQFLDSILPASPDPCVCVETDVQGNRRDAIVESIAYLRSHALKGKRDDDRHGYLAALVLGHCVRREPRGLHLVERGRRRTAPARLVVARRYIDGAATGLWAAEFHRAASRRRKGHDISMEPNRDEWRVRSRPRRPSATGNAVCADPDSQHELPCSLRHRCRRPRPRDSVAGQRLLGGSSVKIRRARSRIKIEWLGDLDSNQGWRSQSPQSYR